MASSSSTSSSRKSKWIYDVFLSFRGEDTRHTITLDLYTALIKAGVHVFMDDRGLEKGEVISDSIMQAIEGSELAVVIFSEDYASSTWCLLELVKIVECRRILGQVVIPVFYYVDPSDVRHQMGSYGESIERHLERFSGNHDRVLQWRDAFAEAANLVGFHFQSARDERQLFEELVYVVLKRVEYGQLFVADHPVGIQSRVAELTMEWWKERSQNVLIIGLWGMGGIGKTTIAKAIYNEIGRYFKETSFLANIREISKQDNGQVNLQKQLISDIIKTEVFKIHNIERGKTIMEKRFPHIKALVALDDVDSLNQLRALCGSRQWFCPGSVIIITTRDLHLLNVLEADYKYEMREMDEIESLELFSWHAFKQTIPSKIFMELSKNVVTYCGGLPLALEVLGSYLFQREIEEWWDVLAKLERIPNKEIQAKLKISFDGLDDDTQKDVFLDICCFFINKDRNYVTHILNGCGLHAINGIQILIERSLIKVSRNNKLEMHDLLRDMGREITCESSPKDLEERSRLWFHKDVIDVLTKHKGTKVIEGIALKFTRTHVEPSIDSKAFEAMKRLRLLQLDYVNVAGDYKYISEELRWLCWHGFPLKYTPDNLSQKNLVAIDFKYSSLKLVWKEPKSMECLKTLILSHSSYLTQTPDFTKLPNLEKLILKDCPSLILVHQSIGYLKNLLLVNLKDCKCLRDLPRSIYMLKSLKTLILSGCAMIDHLEEDFEQMESLTTLMADNTAITQVPFSLARLEGFVHGYVSFCGYEGRSQDIFPSLVWSWMSPTNIAQSCSHAFLLSISSLVLSAIQNGSFHGLSPLLGHLSKLRSMWEKCRTQFKLNGKMERLLDALYGTNFMELESTPSTLEISCMEASASSDGLNQIHIARPADSFNSLLIQMGACNKVDLLKERILQYIMALDSCVDAMYVYGRNYGGWDDSHLPGDQYPDWFRYKGEGRSVFLKVPQVMGCYLIAMVLNVVYSCYMDSMTSHFLINILIINYTKTTVHDHKGDSVTFHEDAQWQGIISSIEPGDLVEFVFGVGPQFTVNKIVAYLIYDGSKRRKLMK